MKSSDDINKELREISPFLAKLKEKEEGYTVPQDYFTGLSDEILDKCRAEKPKPVPAAPSVWEQVLGFLESLLQPKFAMAFASIVLLAVALFVFFPKKDKVMVAQELFTEEEAVAYIYDNIEDFGQDLLEEEFEGSFDWNDVYEINEEDLEQYIEDNVLQDLDETTLEELL